MEPMDDSSWDWIHIDGKIKKRIINQGTIRRHPYDNYSCRVLFKYIDCKGSIGGLPLPGEEMLFTINEGESEFERSMGLVLFSMIPQEEAECELEIQQSFINACIVLLNSTPPLKQVYEMTEEEKMKDAERLKEKASELISRHRYLDAIHFLRRSFYRICWAGGNLDDQSDIYFAVIANWSLCCLHLAQFELCCELTGRVLERMPRHVKCLMRRAKAANALQEPFKAKQDLETVLEVEPHNSEALGLLNEVKLHIHKQRIESTCLAKKMLQL